MWFNGSMQNKKCRKCGLDKPLTEFHKRGKNGRQPRCKTCASKMDHDRWLDRKTEHYAQRKLRVKEIVAWMNTLKSNPCTDCERTFPPVAMGWDHLPGHKKAGNISNMVKTGVSKERILKEVAKCELVCACCHAIRTEKRTGLSREVRRLHGVQEAASATLASPTN